MTILSCGCKSDYMGFPAMYPSQDREGNDCTVYAVLCERHFHEYEAEPAQYTPELTKREHKYMRRIAERADLLRRRLADTQMRHSEEITQELHALDWALAKLAELTS